MVVDQETQQVENTQATKPQATETQAKSAAATKRGTAEPIASTLPDLVQELAAEQTGFDKASASIDMLKDVDLTVKIELGRSRMLVEDVIKLAEGSVVELDKLAGDPVDIYVNERLVARGEVLVLNENFCVRVSQIVVDPI